MFPAEAHKLLLQTINTLNVLKLTHKANKYFFFQYIGVVLDSRLGTL